MMSTSGLTAGTPGYALAGLRFAYRLSLCLSGMITSLAVSPTAAKRQASDALTPSTVSGGSATPVLSLCSSPA